MACDNEQGSADQESTVVAPSGRNARCGVNAVSNARKTASILVGGETRRKLVACFPVLHR